MPDRALLDRLVEDFLAHWARFHPVDITFMGLPGADHRLPPAGPDCAAEEAAALAGLSRRLAALPEGANAGERLDARLMRAAIAHEEMQLATRWRGHLPTFYSGEAAFGLISLLLPSAPEGAAEAVASRLADLPRFLREGIARLEGRALPPDWCRRAAGECAALRRLLTEGLPRHALWREQWRPLAEAAELAVAGFATTLDDHAPADVAIGREPLAWLMREVHGLPWLPEEAIEMAEAAFREIGEAIAAHDRRHGPPEPEIAVAPEALPAAYREQHEQALALGRQFVTPAADYSLDFRELPEWARDSAGNLYFLSYRCPPAGRAGDGSIYWTAPVAQAPSAIRQTHAIHHGSIGHHTQNARARAAASHLARLGGTDCAAAIAFLSAGTLVEGWSCYATELMAELDGFYSPAERRADLAARQRNAASVLADIRLHTGAWSLDEMRAFYAGAGGFPAQRVLGETTRNSIYPASRLMYFLGTRQIRDLRTEFRGDLRTFHDHLLGFGHAPVAWIGEEMRRAREALQPA